MKTIHIYLWALLLGGMATVYSQTVEDVDKNKSFIPNSTPPAPEAFAMTKYGDVPVDEFNGKVNLSVPITEYKAGMLSVPVSVNYNGAGVKVADTPTQVGINWTLNAGGLISREIKGQPDEVVDKLTIPLTQVMALNQPDCSTEAQQLRAIIDNKNIDKENDIFNFNFLGYSGSFFLNDTFDPVLTKNDQELRIEIVGAQTDKRERLRVERTFLITTPDGVKYYFGGTSAWEDSAMMIRNNGNPDLNSIGGITSFYLYKIEHPLNGTILLDYETTSPHYVPINMNYFRIHKSIDQEAFEILDAEEETYGCPGLPETAVSISGGDTQTQHFIVNERMVKKIYSPDNPDYILFNRDLYDSAMSFKKVLKSIEYYKGANVFQKVSFEYIGLAPLNIFRFFLTKVDFNNHVNGMDNKREAYVFEYNDPTALPGIHSYSKDVLGFFNDKPNIDLYPHFPMENQESAPDRTSDFTYASKGVLKKVIYPTKGYTEFDYESQPYVEPKYTTYGLNTYYSNGPLDGEGVLLNGVYQKLHDEIPGISIDEETQQQYPHVIETVQYTQQVNVTLSCSTTNELTPPDFREFNVEVKIIEKLNGNVVSTTEKRTDGSITFPYTFKVGHDYKIEMDLIPSNTANSDYSSTGHIGFQLKTGFHAPTGYGVRLKRTKNYEANNSAPSIKRYYYKPYHKLDDINIDSFKFTNQAKIGGYILFCQVSSVPGAQGLDVVSTTVNTQTLNSNINFLDNTLVSTMRDYNCVTVSYGGDNFELGGIEKTFALADPQIGERIVPVSDNEFANNSILYFTHEEPFSNPNPLRGQVIKEKVFSNSNGVKKIKETEHTYSNIVTDKKYNLTGGEFLTDQSVVCTQSGGSNGRVLSNYWISYYYTNSHDFKKTAQKEVTYIDPVPASLVAHEPAEFENPDLFPTQEELEASYKKITTTQSYEYGTLRGMPTKVTTTNSDGTIQNSENIYVNQYGTLMGLTNPQIDAYAALLAQNNVGSPIETKQTDNSGILGKKRTTYQILSGNKVVPELIQTAKGTLDLEDRAVFEEYDSKGNATLMSLKGGVKIKYLYNAKNQVIAKLENFNGTLDANTNSIADACTFIGQYPNAQVSVFEYDPVTNLLVKMYDPNCKTMTYEYDALHRLQLIRDHENNVIKEFDQNFKN